MPHLQEKLYKSKDNEATHEDSTRGDPRVTDMQGMRQEVPDQIGIKGASEDKLRRRKELKEGSTEVWGSGVFPAGRTRSLAVGGIDAFVGTAPGRKCN